MKIINSTFWKTIFLSALLIFTSNLLNATVCTFTNGGGDNLWNNTANWDAAKIPTIGDDVIISTWTLTINQDINVNSFSISSGATVSFNHPGTSYIGDFTISGGSISSGNKIIISNSFNWSGTSSITTSSSIELSASCSGIISGSGNRNLYGQLLNYGTCTHTGGSLRFQTGGSIENYGTYTVDGADFIINTGGNSFTNYGVFNKNNSNSLSLFVQLDQPGTGQLNINEGAINLISGGSNTGTSIISIASGASLNISSGTYTSSLGTIINGAGDIEFSGSTTTIEGAYTLSGNTEISGGTVNFNNINPTSFTDLLVSGGTLQGSSQLIVNNAFKWTGTSSIKNTDTLKLAGSTANLIYTGGSKNLYTPLVNDGSISFTEGDLRFYSGGSIENNGTFTVNGPINIYDDGGNSFENNGMFEHQRVGTLNIYPDFNNNISGAVKGKGTIEFNTLNNLGTFIADATSGTLNLTGTYDNGNALEIGFDNAIHGALIISNDITISGGLEVNINGSVPSGVYTILSTTAGNISGTFDTENLTSDFIVQYTPTQVNLLVSLLPVELIDFKILGQRDNVLLYWQTASEMNSESFMIEHCTDGQSFYSIGEVSAAGTSNTIQNYQFTHHTPSNGINYYRLRQQDIDGHFEYSDLRVLNFYHFENEVSVYPNPTLGNIVVKNQSDKEFKLTLTDLNGKVMYSRGGIIRGATALDLHGLPKSMYILEVFDGPYSYKERIMILE